MWPSRWIFKWPLVQHWCCRSYHLFRLFWSPGQRNPYTTMNQASAPPCVKQASRIPSSSSLWSTDLGTFKKKWGIAWRRYAYGKLGLSVPFVNASWVTYNTRCIGVSNFTIRPRKAGQERRSSPSREPGLFSLSNFSWPPNLINCTHIDFVTPLQFHVKKPLLEYHARHGIAVEAYGRLTYIPSLSRSLSIPPKLSLRESKPNPHFCSANWRRTCSYQTARRRTPHYWGFTC